jgi:large subunit ribosomal protein L10
MAHVADWKYKEIEDLTSLLTKYPVVGIAEIGGIPAPQMQQMRKNIRDHAIIRSSKNTLLFRSFDNAEEKVKDISSLKEVVTGQTAIIATEMNPFKLYGMLKKTRTKAPAKGGEIAPEDIMVKAGDTPFKPGPIVGDLQKVGIPAAIQGGKVVIKKDKVIVKEGDKIPREVAQMLTRLEIYPLEIGINLQGAFEEGFVFKPDVLDVDVDQYISQVKQAVSNAFGLALETAWPHALTIQPLLMKAQRDTIGLAISQNIVTPDTVQFILSKAHRSMLSVASQLKEDGLDEDLKKMMT